MRRLHSKLRSKGNPEAQIPIAQLLRGCVVIAGSRVATLECGTLDDTPPRVGRNTTRPQRQAAEVSLALIRLAICAGRLRSTRRSRLGLLRCPLGFPRCLGQALRIIPSVDAMDVQAVALSFELNVAGWLAAQALAERRGQAIAHRV